jgi:acetyl-CoA carboxylase beta subunit
MMVGNFLMGRQFGVAFKNIHPSFAVSDLRHGHEDVECAIEVLEGRFAQGSLGVVKGAARFTSSLLKAPHAKLLLMNSNGGCYLF